MACQGCTSLETKCIHEQEEAFSTTVQTCQLDKLLRLSKGVTQAPADNFWELKSNIATFMALVWVLFGLECYYYKGLQNVHATLELKEVMAQKSAFTAEHCRRITWAIINDGRARFNDVKRGRDELVYPQSFLVTSYGMYATPYRLRRGQASPTSRNKRSAPLRKMGEGVARGGGAQL
jgi:hypothetical protein